MTNTPQGTGAAVSISGPMTLEQGLAAYKARNPNAKPEDVVVPTLPEDGIDDGYEEPAHEGEVEEAEPTELEAGQTEQEEPEQVEKPEPDTRPVILPDGTEITVEEARKGYLRQDHFTRNSQSLAREKETLVVEKTVFAQQAQKLLKDLDALQEKEPNWMELSRSGQYSPEQYNQIQAWWQDRNRTVAAAQNAVAQAQRQEQEVQKNRFYDELLSGRHNPEWTDQAKLKDSLGKNFTYVQSHGFTPQQFDAITDPRLLVYVDKARMWDEANKQKPAVKRALSGKPAVVKPSSRAVATPSGEGIRAAEERFGKSKTLADGMALFNAKQAARRPLRR